MDLQERKVTFVELGRLLAKISNGEGDESWNETILRAKAKNGWFTEENAHTSLAAISTMLGEQALSEWLSAYQISEAHQPKTVGLVMAGNIPLVGFHDMLCVLMSGNKALVKCASLDDELPRKLVETIISIEPRMAEMIEVTDGKFENIDAVIATGSDNSARYFEYYFGKYPNIIRKNRSSVAVLDGTESSDDLMELGRDIFRYFGLGCRNVSQLMVPADYDLKDLLTALQPWEAIRHHSKYFNNYEYHKAILLVEKIDHLDNGFLLLKEDVSIHCPVGMLHFVRYNNDEDLKQLLLDQKDQIQCIVSTMELDQPTVPFGKAQEPELSDYADGVDTMKFLIELGMGTLLRLKSQPPSQRIDK